MSYKSPYRGDNKSRLHLPIRRTRRARKSIDAEAVVSAGVFPALEVEGDGAAVDDLLALRNVLLLARDEALEELLEPEGVPADYYRRRALRGGPVRKLEHGRVAVAHQRLVTRVEVSALGDAAAVGDPPALQQVA